RQISGAHGVGVLDAEVRGVADHRHRAGLSVALADVGLRRMDAELRGLGLDDRHGELTEDRGLLEPAADGLAVTAPLGLHAADADEVAPCRSEKHEAPVLTALHRDEVDATTSLVPRHGLSGERVEFPLVAQIRTQALGATLGGLTGHLAKRLVGLL